MSKCVRGALWVAVILLGAAVSARAAVPPPRGIGIEEPLDGPAVLADAWPAQRSGPRVALVLHLVVDIRTFQGAGSAAALARLDGRLETYASRGIPVVLVLGAMPAGDAEAGEWRQTLRSIAQHVRGRIAGYQFGAAAEAQLPAVETYAFLLKQLSVAIRSVDADALVALGPVPPAEAVWLGRVFAEGIAPYVDAVALAGPAREDDLPFRAAVEHTRTLVAREDPSASVWLGPVAISEPPGPAVQRFVQAVLLGLGEVGVTVFRMPVPALRGALTAATRLADLLSGEIVTLDAPPFRWLRGGEDVTSQIASRLLYGVSSGQTYFVYTRTGSAALDRGDLEIDINMSAPALRDPITGGIDRLNLPPREIKPARLTLRLANRPLVLDFNFGQSVYSTTAEARQAVLPEVEEIVARHQQVQAAQDALVRNYVADLRIELRFHPTPADPAYTVLTENRLFSDASGVEWVERSFSLNGALWKGRRPSFPLLQPEKVLSLPLELRLSRDYRYRLAGVERVDGREAYAVRFDPVDPARALYRGTVWIDRETFVRLKISAIETRGRGVVQANEEEQLFSPAGEIDGRPIWLLTHLTSRQTFLVAGRTLLNERDVRMTDIRLNAPDFEAARGEARAGDQVMYRDTDLGVRYFVKKGETRVVSENLTASARAWAMGVDIDPSLEYPLPILGIDILDFNFLHRDLQLALLFGGVIAMGNVQRSGLLDGRLDASVDFFGLALKTNDLVFDGAGERRGERVRTMPASAGLNVGFRISSAHKVSGRLEVRHDAYSRAPEADAAFVAPSSTTTLGEGIGYEYRRRGYSFIANATTYRRSGWRSWGDVTTFDPATRTYARYDLGVSKDVALGTFQTLHLNGQYFGGRRLDRFSMYQFGLFDAARMHGVPGAVRFGELAMFRGSYSFNLFDQYRLDLFLDQAAGRASGRDERWRPVTGVGVGINLRARGTILRADVGRSFLPAFYRGAGSTVVQILVLKPL